MIILRHIPAELLADAADLYWDAFEPKLGKVLGPSDRGKQFVRKVIRADHGLCAVGNDGRLLGVAGFKTIQGALVGGDLRDLWDVYGLGAFWRGAVLKMLVRDIENRRFLMDGLVVAADTRSKGVGTALLHAVYEFALERGYSEVRLDVVEGNNSARRLYEKEGFVPIKTDNLGLLRFLFGFSRSTTMVKSCAS